MKYDKTNITNISNIIEKQSEKKGKPLSIFVSDSGQYVDLTDAIEIDEPGSRTTEKAVKKAKRTAYDMNKYWRAANKFFEGKFTTSFAIFFVIILLGIGYISMPYILPKHNTPANDYNNSPIGTPYPMNGGSLEPIALVDAASVSTTPTPAPVSTTPTVTPAPVATINNVPNITVIPSKTPTVTPSILPSGEKYVDMFNYIHVNGLNSNYVLKPNQQLKKWSNYMLDLTFQNVNKTDINSINVVITACKYDFNKQRNEPVLGAGYTIFSDNINIKLSEYDVYKYSQTFKIPGYTGTYLLIVNCYADNGANYQVHQLVNIIA
jgi:hypothetical protein